MPFLDENNLPYHTNDKGQDFGDCIHNVGRIAILTGDLNTYRQRMSHLIINGKLRRHPTQWNDPNNITSDATEPIILANLLLNEHGSNQMILNNLVNNNFFYQNSKDILRPHHLSMWGRFKDNRFIYLIGDIWLLLFVLYRQLVGSRLKTKQGMLSVSDDVNLILMIKVFKVIKPTWLIRLADKIYTRKDFCWEYYFKGRSELGDYMMELYK